jgi:hypothetical protein
LVCWSLCIEKLFFTSDLLLLQDPLFVPRFATTLSEEREIAYQRLDKVCKKGFFSVKDFKTTPQKIFAAHELLSMVDGSCATKMTVQFNLVGSFVLQSHVYLFVCLFFFSLGVPYSSWALQGTMLSILMELIALKKLAAFA